MGVKQNLRQAAAILLTRQGKVWLARRGKARFLPGFWVFPGGALEQGETHLQAALRETQEETGLVIEDPARLIPFARAITPKFSKLRFDARIFRCELADDEEPSVDGKELIEGLWLESTELWTRYTAGDLQLAPPTYRQLSTHTDAIEGYAAWPTPQEAFSAPPESHEEILPMAAGITVLPLLSPALPPAAWTNTVLVGTEDFYIIDPGGIDSRALIDEVAHRNSEGYDTLGVILTHHHPDHIVGYHDLGLEHLPLWCHPITEALLPESFPKPVHLNDGDRLEASTCSLVAHFTPGHAPGHLCLEVPERKALIAADLISSLSSIVIPADDGDLNDYLTSLSRMRELDCHLVIPSHGPAFGQGSDPFGQAIAHRQYREEQILRILQLADIPKTITEVVESVYPGLDSRLLPSAQSNVIQHLRKLRDDQRVIESGERWTTKT